MVDRLAIKVEERLSEMHRPAILGPVRLQAIIFSLFMASALTPTLRASGAAESSLDSPSLVELFTSEGCSSCPPADALLARIAEQSGEVITLSEHVTYWNHQGWNDPYSSEKSTSRQSDYARRFRIDGPYTPQMVVDGRRQFVGSDKASLQAALSSRDSSSRPALSVSIPGNQEGSAILRAAVKLEQSASSGRLIAVLVQNQGRQQVAGGENAGRSIGHVNIAREFHDLGGIAAGKNFESETSFKLPKGTRSSDYHVVVFLQQGEGGPILTVSSTSQAQQLPATKAGSAESARGR